jgi:hypothetical protein
MQTRSQTRNLAIAQSQALAPTKVLTKVLAPTKVLTKVLAPTKVLESTKVLTTRILPDSIKNVFYDSEYTLYMPQYLQKPLDIDFDEASEAWRANKISIGNGQYKYKKRITTIKM